MNFLTRFSQMWKTKADETDEPDTIRLPTSKGEAAAKYSDIIDTLLKKDPLPGMITFPGGFWKLLKESAKSDIIERLEIYYWIGPVTREGITFLSKESWHNQSRS